MRTGQITANNLTIGGGGIGDVVQLGGTIAATSLSINNGTFNQVGGNNTVGTLALGLAGTYTLGNTGTLNADSIAGSNYFGSGTINIDGGTLKLSSTGSINNVSEFNVGNAVGSNGSFTLAAAQAINTRNQTIGVYGTGTFVQNGGTNTVNILKLGKESGSSGTYTLSGNGTLRTNWITGGLGTSTFNLDSDMGYYSYSASPYSISVTNFNVGTSRGSYGSLFMRTGQITANNLTIGGGGIGDVVQLGGTITAGSLNINNGTFYQTATGTTTISGATTNAGNVNIYGGTFTSGTFANSGSLNLEAGGKLVTTAFTQTAGSTVLNNGIIDPPTTITVTGGSFGGVGTVIGDLSLSNASLIVGPGTLGITGSFTEKNGTLTFYFGPSPTSLLTISSGYSITGTTVIFNFADGSTLPGDFNINNFINGSAGSFTDDRFQYAIGSGPVQNLNFDSKTGILSVAAVPEPETYAMLLAGLGLLGIATRRRRKQA
jgi:hypothetical protein